VADPAFYINTAGSVVPVASDEAAGAAELGWIPASPQQIQDFQIEAKYGSPGQQAITAVEHAASALTFGASDVAERVGGLSTPEAMAGREQANPGAAMLGTAAGVALPLVSTLGGASAFTAPSLIARAGQAATRGAEALLPAGESALARMAVRAASAGAGSAIEGAAYGAGQVVHEAALGDPNLTAQSALATIGFSAALGAGIGGAGGVLAQGFREIGPSDIGAKLRSWAGEFEGERNIKAAGALKSDVRTLRKQFGREHMNAIGREAGEAGYVGPLSTPGSTLDKTQAALDDIGPKIGLMTKAADTAVEAGEGEAPKIAEVAAKARAEILSPLEANPLEQSAAKQVGGFLDGYEKKFAQGMSFTDLHDMEQEIGTKIYGLRGTLDPDSKVIGRALHDLRGIVSDELESGMKRVGLDSDEWNTLRRQYHVAKTVNRIADNAQDAVHGNNMVSLTEGLGAMTGALHGGPATGALAGAATAALRRHASGTLGAVARSVRLALEPEAAGAVANRTAQAIQAARQIGQDTLTGQATNQPETVAALSLLERMRQSVSNQIDSGVSGIVRAAPKAATVGRSEAAAGIASIFAKSHEDATAIYSKRISDLQKLAQNPQELHATLERQTDDWHEHAPNTAQAVQTASARAVSFLASKVPKHESSGPLAPKWAPTKSEVAKFNRYYEAVQRPTSILKAAAAGTLTPEALEAVKTVYPALFQQIQSQLMDKLASKKDVPYRSRLMLSMLLGQNIDGSTNGMTIARNQMAMAPQPMPQPSPARADKLSVADRAMTDTQRSAERGE
jgi:hypothetical protein